MRVLESAQALVGAILPVQLVLGGRGGENSRKKWRRNNGEKIINVRHTQKKRKQTKIRKKFEKKTKLKQENKITKNQNMEAKENQQHNK